MISVTDLRSGVVFEDNGQIYQVLSYEHIKMGRGSANIKVKVKNVRSGATLDKSFINGARVNNLQITKKDLQFLYKDGQSAHFMDTKTFEQIEINLKHLPEHNFLREGETFSLSFLDNEALSLNLAPKMNFKVVETGPSTRGNSATNVYKDAVLENGLTIKIPLFINVDDVVRIDTRTVTYSEKA